MLGRYQRLGHRPPAHRCSAAQCRSQEACVRAYDRGFVHAAATPGALPDFIPAQYAEEIEEPKALELLSRYYRIPLSIPSLGNTTIQTGVVGPSTDVVTGARGSPVVLLHGFDSSSLEFRRLIPELEQRGVEAWGVDLVGWGFTDSSHFLANPRAYITPEHKREHLAAFWRSQVDSRPMVLVGASLGGAVAMDFALTFPEAVDRLVLIDAQGFIDGIGLMSKLPRPLALAGVAVLRTEQLRMAANRMAYHDQAFATRDAMLCGRLHTHLPGWAEANAAFMAGGGYSISKRIPNVKQDEILPTENARRFQAALPTAELQWLDPCGHCGHLEQAAAVADAVVAFAGCSCRQSNAGVVTVQETA